MPKNPSTAYSIRFTPEELAALRRRAEREDKPVSEIIREALAGSNVSRETNVQVTAANDVPLKISFFRGTGPSCAAVGVNAWRASNESGETAVSA